MIVVKIIKYYFLCYNKHKNFTKPLFLNRHRHVKIMKSLFGFLHNIHNNKETITLILII
jgi:hypothetical protein